MFTAFMFVVMTVTPFFQLINTRTSALEQREIQRSISYLPGFVPFLKKKPKYASGNGEKHSKIPILNVKGDL